jgi:lysophospholipase L1-like esterase
MGNAQKTYLALGDSYTICEGLNYEKTWPYHLSTFLTSNNVQVNPPTIIAKTGWRTDELIEAIDNELDEEQFNVVSLLIGVNNEYQGKPFSKYQEELKTLIEVAIKRCITGSKGVFMLSIPDYGVTPFAVEKEKTEAIKTLKKYNSYAKKLCKTYNIAFYDITKLSKKLSKNEDYLHDDKLHPNEKQYLAWIDSFKHELLEHLTNE